MAFSAVTVAILCVSTSVYQASSFLSSLASNQIEKVGLYIATFAIIVSSSVLCRLIGVAIRRESPGWMIACAVACVLAVEVFSVATSMSAFSNHAYTKQYTENRQSAEYKVTMNAINNLQNAINEKQIAMEKMPSTWITRRETASDRISEMNIDLMQMNAGLGRIQSSATGRTFSEVESTTGLTVVKMALIAAILLSAIPATIGMLSSNITVSGVIATGKKSSTEATNVRQFRAAAA